MTSYRLTLEVKPRELYAKLKDKSLRTARDVSWHLLGQAAGDLEESYYGDSSENCLGLAVIEQALDWWIGTAVVTFLQASVKGHRMLPKPFKVGVTPEGRVDVIGGISHKVYFSMGGGTR